MNLFAFGLGYSARHFVRRYRDRLGHVDGTVTSPESVAALESEGIQALLFDRDTADSDIHSAVAQADALLVSIPPDENGDPALRRFGDAIAAAPRLAWIGYLSTVGVYGDHRGGWVDETTPPAPANERSRQRLRAEDDWLAFGSRSGKPVHVFRLAGIYGPGRNPLAQLAAGTARRIVKPGQVFNRIHVDDIATVLMASIARPNGGAVYNLADDEPSPPEDVVAYAARLAGIEPPPEVAFDDARLGSMAASFWDECKRVSNRRIKDELGVTLRHATYREGLSAIRAAGGTGPAISGRSCT
jgi:nucleoside-diphosphate-sugar epimerase